MSNAEKVLAKLRALGVELPAGAEIRRTYASRAGLNAGAWVWQVWSGDRSLDLGSQFRLSDLSPGSVDIVMSTDPLGDRYVDPVTLPRRAESR